VPNSSPELDPQLEALLLEGLGGGEDIEMNTAFWDALNAEAKAMADANPELNRSQFG
jgi:hypothetical protein